MAWEHTFPLQIFQVLLNINLERPYKHSLP